MSASRQGVYQNDTNPPGDAVPGKVWFGTLLLGLGRIWGSVCTALTLMLCARILSEAELGRFAFYLVVLLLLDSTTDFGTGQLVVQRGSKDAQALGRALRAGRWLRAGFAGAGFVLVGTCVFLSGEAGGAWIVLAALYPFSRILELSVAPFQVDIRWERPVLVRALAATLRFALVLALASMGVERAEHYLLAHALGLAIGNVALHLAARQRLAACRSGEPLRTLGVRGFLLAAAPLGLAGVCQAAYFWVDNLFVRGLWGDVEVGHYGVAVRLFSLFVMVSVHATAAALPWLSRHAESGDLGSATAELAQVLFAAGCLGAGLLLPWSEEVLVLLFGTDYAAATGSLKWLLLAGVVIYAGAAPLTAVVAAGSTRAVLAITSVALGVNLVGNTLLVPAHGGVGAAVATAATELAVLLGAIVTLWRLDALPCGRPRRWLVGPLVFAAGFLLSRSLLP